MSIDHLSTIEHLCKMKNSWDELYRSKWKKQHNRLADQKRELCVKVNNEQVVEICLSFSCLI